MPGSSFRRRNSPTIRREAAGRQPWKRWSIATATNGTTSPWRPRAKLTMSSAAVPQPAPQPIALVVSDVDGTLVTPEKVITPRVKKAVDELRRAGIRFTITSSRPPRGLKRVIEELKLTDPIPGFNRGEGI